MSKIKIDSEVNIQTAARKIFENGFVGVAKIQRHLKMGYFGASKFIDDMFKAGIVGNSENIEPTNKILVTLEELTSYLEGKQL